MPSSLTSSRRRTLAAVVLLASAALALSACDSTTTATTAPAAAVSRTVQTLYGKVTVPTHATRIVALDFPEATALADFGIKPVGIDNYIPALPAYTTFFKGLPVVTNSAGLPEVEKVAALKPDLIIGDEFASDVAKNRNLYKQLSAIAPTVMLTWTQAAGNWQADAAGTAAAVGKTTQINKLKSAYLAHAAQIKTTYAQVLATHSVDLVSASNASDWYLYGPTSSHGKVLAAAGARFGAAVAQKAGYVEYSTEKYSLLNHTGMVIVDASAPGDLGVANNVTASPTFTELPAAQAHHVFASPYFWPSSYRIADALLDDFAAALKQVQR